MHGANSKFTEVAAAYGLNLESDFVEKPWPDWWYFGEQKRLVNEADNDDAELERVRRVFFVCFQLADMHALLPLLNTNNTLNTQKTKKN